MAPEIKHIKVPIGPDIRELDQRRVRNSLRAARPIKAAIPEIRRGSRRRRGGTDLELIIPK